ncbi:MAG TPA: hypothetical protein EYN66_01260, partial [Myxococcales bacterium]|nr:hypothetical protein [Myxococcales bacterium]
MAADILPELELYLSFEIGLRSLYFQIGPELDLCFGDVPAQCAPLPCRNFPMSSVISPDENYDIRYVDDCWGVRHLGSCKLRCAFGYRSDNLVPIISETWQCGLKTFSSAESQKSTHIFAPTVFRADENAAPFFCVQALCEEFRADVLYLPPLFYSTFAQFKEKGHGSFVTMRCPPGFVSVTTKLGITDDTGVVLISASRVEIDHPSASDRPVCRISAFDGSGSWIGAEPSCSVLQCKNLILSGGRVTYHPSPLPQASAFIKYERAENGTASFQCLEPNYVLVE